MFVKSNVILTCSVLAAAILAVALGDYQSHPAPAQFDPADDLLDSKGLWWDAPQVITLDEAVARISKAAGVEIVLDWPELESAGISRGPSWPMPYEYHGYTLRSTLTSLTERFSTNHGPAPTPKFTRTAKGALLVSIDHNTTPGTRVYDVRDLLSDTYWPSAPASANLKDIESARAETFMGVMQARIIPIDYLELPHEPRVDQFVTLDGRLIITTMPAKHQHLERILAALRRDD